MTMAEWYDELQDLREEPDKVDPMVVAVHDYTRPGDGPLQRLNNGGLIVHAPVQSEKATVCLRLMREFQLDVRNGSMPGVLLDISADERVIAGMAYSRPGTKRAWLPVVPHMSELAVMKSCEQLQELLPSHATIIALVVPAENSKPRMGGFVALAQTKEMSICGSC